MIHYIPIFCLINTRARKVACIALARHIQNKCDERLSRQPWLKFMWDTDDCTDALFQNFWI